MPITPAQAAELTEDQQVYLERLEDYVDDLLKKAYDPKDTSWVLVIQVDKLRALIPDEYGKRIGLFIRELAADFKAVGWSVENPDSFYPPTRIFIRKA